MFITVEGGDGVGKSTQVGLLAQDLAARGYDVHRTFEPGDTPLGAELRRLVQHSDDMAARTEALLYAADRAEHVARVIRPKLAAGCIVLCDRYIDSSVAYQGEARGLGPDQIRELSLFATEHLVPNLTLLLDLDPERAAARRTGVPDRLEREDLSFHRRVRERFLAAAAADPGRYVVLDASRPIEEVFGQLRDAVLTRLQDGGSRQP
ncbi:MAG: dTMP kinase [Bowdeniella nasicola]|nr:dTMP kinase [Bowdeniella nasicola]